MSTSVNYHALQQNLFLRLEKACKKWFCDLDALVKTKILQYPVAHRCCFNHGKVSNYNVFGFINEFCKTQVSVLLSYMFFCHYIFNITFLHSPILLHESTITQIFISLLTSIYFIRINRCHFNSLLYIWEKPLAFYNVEPLILSTTFSLYFITKLDIRSAKGLL